MIRGLSYNLPGYGFANCYLIGQAIDVVDLLECNGFIEKMHNICQLGTMKYVYPGAHHTRYEYVFTQLMLISNIAKSDTCRNVELSLSANLAEYEQLGHSLSGSALMQCLAILSNAGHMYDTFTASRILLRLLKESKEEKTDFYAIYKRNLPKAIRRDFDEVLSAGNYYKLHLFHVIQILQGMCRATKNKNICELCIHIVSQLIAPNLILNEATQRIFFLYKKIRKIAYLSVDMVYTPASFGANLSRMVYSISSYIDDLFDENSAMNKSIQQLEDIIHQQIYNSPMCIINSTRIEQETCSTYKKYSKKVHDVFQLRDYLLERDVFSCLHSQAQPKAIHGMDAGSTLLISRERDMDEEYDLNCDAQAMIKMPASRIAHGTQLAQNLRRIYSAYGLISVEHIHKDTQTIISDALGQHLFDETNHIELVKYAIKSIYKYGEFFFNFTAPTGFSVNDCVFWGSGCKKMAARIKKRFSKNNVSNADQLHEILSCATVLESLNYSGAIICFVGSIKANKYKKTEKVDELDGFIYLPNKSTQKGFAYIIEAKNFAGGEKAAEKQLQATCKFIASDLDTNIEKLTKCAYLRISQKTSG